MSKKLLFMMVTMALVLSTVALAQRPIPQEKREFERANPGATTRSGPAVRRVDPSAPTSRRPDLLGTIFYDDGVVTTLPAASSNCFGNQFNTALGNPVQASGSVTKMSFYIVQGAGNDNVFISVFGPVNGTTAPVLISVSVPLNNGSAAFNTHTFATPINYGGPSFLAGVWYVAGDTVGLGSGTVNGQGFHAMLINDIVGTNFQTIPSLNALVGASGNVIQVPVELMTFDAN